MSKVLTPTELRRDIYRILDEILDTGEPRQVVRGEQRIVLMPLSPPPRKLDKLPQRRTLTCPPEELVEISWEKEWQPGL